MEKIDHLTEGAPGELLPIKGKSLNLPLCDVRVVLSDEKLGQLEEDLAGLASQQRADAATILGRTGRL